MTSNLSNPKPPLRKRDTARLQRVVSMLVVVPFLMTAGFVAATSQPDVTKAQFEPGEQWPGGTATTRKAADHRDVFSQASRGIGFEGESRFKIGNAIFRKLWVSSPASTVSSDGLGPLYNARACQNCHLKDGRGAPPSGMAPLDRSVSMLMRLSVPPKSAEDRALLASRKHGALPEQTYGGQLQGLAVQGQSGEGHVGVTYAEKTVTYPDGDTVVLRVPTYHVTDLGYGEMAPDTMMSPRVAPPMIGLGLLDAIPDADIRALADPQDDNGDGISGRPQEVWSIDKQAVVLGRFGWKAGNPTVRQQTADAFAGDMGLSTSLIPAHAGDCTPVQQKCQTAPHGETPAKTGFEVSDALFDFVTFYAQNLAVPMRRDAQAPDVLRGKHVFSEIGCAACHVPRHKTGEVRGQPHLSEQTIWPYTDLLLHDLGEGLADNRPDGVATGREWRTPPLWGVGLTEVVSGHNLLLHDGRARGIEEAILWHGGEADAVREKFMALLKSDRGALIRFVSSL